MKRIGSTGERLADTPYAQRVCRIENGPACIATCAGERFGLAVEEYVDLIHDVGLEVQVVAGQDNHQPRFQSAMLPPHPDIAQDLLPRFVELAHENGIIVLTYYGMTAGKLLVDIHPEWLMRYLDDGRPPPEKPYWFCMNSPYRDWLPEYLKEFVEHLDLDGFYFDGTNWGSHCPPPYYPGCCCKHCERLFREDTSLEIPTVVDFDSRDFRRFLLWQRDKLRAFMTHVTRQVHTTHPDAILDFNHYAGVYNNWVMGHPANPLGVDREGGYFFVEKTLYDGTSFTAKYVKAHGGTGGVWFGPIQSMPECANHTAPYPEPVTQTLDCLSVMANGARPIIANVPYPSPLYADYLKQVFNESKRRVDYMDGETVKYVALHWSEQSRDFHRASNDPYQAAAEYFKRLRGTYEMLNRSHHLVDFVFDEQLTDEYLAPYRVLFLSDSACLSDAQCGTIRRFVQAGGTLIATHETSLQDELGCRHDNFALADLFGVDYRDAEARGAVHGCIYVPHDAVLRRELGDVICYAGESAQVVLRPGDPTDVLCTKSSLTGPRPLDRFHPGTPYDSGKPTVTVHAVGKGKAYYINGDIGGAFTANPYPPLKRFLANLVKRTRPPIEIEAPWAIEASALVRPQAGANSQDLQETLIHLVNYPIPYCGHSASGESADWITRYVYNLEDVVPVHDIKITFNDVRPASVHMPLQGCDLEITGDPPSVVVPEVRMHEVITAQ